MPEKHKLPSRFRFFFTGPGFHQTISRNTKNIYIIIYVKASTILENLTVNIFLLLYMPKKVPVYPSPIRLRIILLIAPHEQVFRELDNFPIHKTNNKFLPLG